MMSVFHLGKVYVLLIARMTAFDWQSTTTTTATFHHDLQSAAIA